MNNVKRVICGHNRNVLSQPPSTSHTVERECNCKKENECPLERKCMEKEIVYEAETTTKDNGEMKEYIGMTSVHCVRGAVQEPPGVI